MSDIEYRLARDEERADIVDFGNYVFSQAHVPHDFKKILPKAYADHLPRLGAEHFIAVRDGRIKGMVALRPIDLKILDSHLKIGFVGTVSVHPYARSEGHMKALMTRMLAYAREQGMDMLVLGGNRQRYNWFGFENAGWAYRFRITESTVKHAFRDLDTEGIAFSSLSPEKPEELRFARELSCRQKVTGDRPEERFLDILHSWNSEARLIRINGEMEGYVTGRVGEMVLKDEKNLLPVLKALWEEEKSDYTVSCPPHETERVRVLSAVAGSYTVERVEMVNVLSWPKVLETLLNLRADFLPLEDGCFTLGIEGEDTVRLTVENGKAHAEHTDGAPDLTLPHLEAERRLFGLEVFSQAGLYKNWFPLPFWMSNVDTF